MPHTSLTDAQIDARATAYARQHQVSYSEALNHVVSFAQSQTSDTTAATDRVTPHDADALTDAQADAAASRYAAQNGVDYVAALRIVLQGQRMAQAANKGGARQPSHASESDQRIDAAATAHARTHGVSYSEALTHVTTFAANFSEGGLLSGMAGGADADAVQAMQSQAIEIFRAGTHVDSAGNTRTFTPQDLQAMAATYNPMLHEAPLTLGHPDADRPAYGWVKSLTATNDGRLLMQADRVDPAFAAGVKASRYKKRSASFYPPHAPNNPKPGQWYLRHVGWLGAQPPAVQGLADVNFGTATDDGAVCFGWM